MHNYNCDDIIIMLLIIHDVLIWQFAPNLDNCSNSHPFSFHKLGGDERKEEGGRGGGEEKERKRGRRKMKKFTEVHVSNS